MAGERCSAPRLYVFDPAGDTFLSAILPFSETVAEATSRKGARGLRKSATTIKKEGITTTTSL